MNWQFIIYLALVPITLCALLASIYLSWRWRKTNKGSAVILLQLSALGWLLMDTMQMVVPGESQTVLFMQFTYIFVVLTPVAWWYFCLVYAGIYERYSRYFLLFFGVPIVHIILVWTNPIHNLFWTSREFTQVFNSSVILDHGYGLFFYTHSIYSYLLIFGGIMVMAYFIYSGPELYRKQLNPFVIGVALLIGYNLLQVVKIIPNLKDFSPILMAVPGLAMVYSLLKYQLLEIQPVTRDSLVDSLQDGVVILTEEDNILDINLSAKRILGIPASATPIGDQIETYLPAYNEMFTEEKGEAGEMVTWKTGIGDQPAYYGVRLITMSLGKIMTFHDTTETDVLIRQVQRLAAIDPLTEIYNRREFFARAEEALKVAIRYHRPLTLMLVDMDKFKEYNDRFGHQIGDEILFTFARYCKSRLRSTDLIGRYGGDEFIMLMPETNIEQGAKLARKMMGEVKDNMVEECGVNCDISISIGLAEYSEMEGEITLDELVQRSDKALYRAKQQGRDRYIRWETSFAELDNKSS